MADDPRSDAPTVTGTSLDALAETVVDSAVPMFPVVSPDGRQVAYVVKTVGARERLVSTVWLAYPDGSAEPRPLTDGQAWVGAPQWAPDSASLYAVVRGQVCRLRREDGSVEPVTSWPAGVTGFRLLEDGRTLAFTAHDEPEAGPDEFCVWDGVPRPARLRLLDLDSGGEPRVVTGLGDRHVVEVRQRPDGGPLAVLTCADTDDDRVGLDMELHLVDPESDTVHDLGPTPPEAGSLAWWRQDDDWHLAFLAVTPPGLVGGTAVFDRTLEPGSVLVNLTADLPLCPMELVQTADGPPLVLCADGLDTPLLRLDPVRPRRVAHWPGLVHALSVSRAGDVVAALTGGSVEPKDVHAGPLAGPLVRVSDTRPEVRALRWGGQERVAWKAADGLDLEGLLLLPPGARREDGPFPLVTLVHGGPYGRFADTFQYHVELPPAQWLAVSGYAVLLPNPRGSQGRGHAFAAAVAGDLGGAEWDDISSGIDALVAEGVADPDRLGIGGWSHGGFMAAWAIGQTDRFKAAVVGAGVADWGLQAAFGDQGAERESALSGSRGWEGPGPHPHDRVSPVSYAARIRTPVLILHGDSDANVPVGQAILLHRALRDHGVDHQLVQYPGEGHGIAGRDHQLDLLRRTRAWFDRRLGPAEGFAPRDHGQFPSVPRDRRHDTSIGG